MAMATAMAAYPLVMGAATTTTPGMAVITAGMMAITIPAAAIMSLIAWGNATAGTIITAVTGRGAGIIATAGRNGGKDAGKIGANGVAVAMTGWNCEKTDWNNAGNGGEIAAINRAIRIVPGGGIAGPEHRYL